ncbi:MAG: carbon-nitrogen hydrolase family protein [Gammaproteobacteria bacterium]
MKFKVACVQNCADDDVAENITLATELVRAARASGADLICLPENFSLIQVSDARLLAQAHTEESHPAIPHFRDLARELGAWILMGSLAIKLPSGKINNRSYLLDDSGRVIASYNKLHLFDVNLKAGESYRESATVEPGDRALVAATPWGGIGLSVCYDLRFAHLYRALAQAGARYLAIPAAFTRTTGQAHWHVLQRARAIETGSYVFAPSQCGIRRSGRATYGHSLIVDPWGRILADGGDESGFVIAEVDSARVEEARRMIPALQHDRGFIGPEADAQ